MKSNIEPKDLVSAKRPDGNGKTCGSCIFWMQVCKFWMQVCKDHPDAEPCFIYKKDPAHINYCC